MRSEIPRSHSRKAQAGYGLMLIMTFFASLVLALVSLQLLSGNTLAPLAAASRQNVTAYDLARSALPLIRADIQSKLDADLMVDGTYLFPGPASGDTLEITMPQSPTNLAGSTIPVGRVSGTVVRAGGNVYLIKATGTVGSVSVSLNQLMQVQKYVPPPFDCTAIETTIQAGNISTLTDNQLTSYAQNNCMVKTVAAPVTAYSVTDGPSTSDCSSGTVAHTGSGTLDVRNTTGTCTRDIDGTYTSAVMEAVSGTVNITSSSPREINATSVSVGVLNAQPATAAITYKLNTVFNYADVKGGSGNDVISLTGNFSDSNLYANNGNDTVMIAGTTSFDDSEEFFMGLGDDTVYLNSLVKASGSIGWIAGDDGHDAIYFQSLNDLRIEGGAGNDTIACTTVFSGGSSCVYGKGATIYGGSGNDIISIGASMTDGATATVGSRILGDAGYNIIYVNGFNASASSYTQTINATTTGNSLVIIAGNRNKGTITATGSNNVLLLKTGTTDTNVTTSGFARTLWY